MNFRKFLYLTLCLITLFICVSCKIENTDIISAESNISYESIESTNTVLVSNDNSEEQVASIKITNDYLTPIEDFSWERTYDAEYIMLHFCSALMVDFENPYDLNKVRQIFIDYKVSIHYIIDRDGKVFCYVPENRVAWHAGKGTWINDEKYTDNMNQYAIGIEILAIGSQSDMSQYLTSEEYNQIVPSLIGYTDAQYEALNDLIEYICENNNIPRDKGHIIGHDEYKPQKTDPGELFEWDRIIK
ncbi:MAG: hypothetical protein A2Y15_05285 [Clostridiales bacterium GWF2_36_10]|nr:MAG: hypothetical protein A2Y15_05285 [Clostridiales bacterium GWF2_36_10]HAN20077.1 N-acetylmuramoyl-L-alanine amidase [Clostridiales bacterium]